MEYEKIMKSAEIKNPSTPAPFFSFSFVFFSKFQMNTKTR